MPTALIHHRLTVDLKSQAYPILIGESLLQDDALLAQFIDGHQVMVVSQQPIASHYLHYLSASLKKYHVDHFIFKAGEQYKTVDQWEKLLVAMLRHKHDRSTTLIALGGGVVGDLTGFAAACFMRGINYLQIPTTLIAQVDAAVGGKTAVNHPLGKNLIGAFHHPKAVLIDVQTLSTLPPREFIAGLAEAIKYGLIMDEAFFAWIESNLQSILAKDAATLLTLIQRCLALKASLVSEDEKDMGRRSLLNFGHTFGHALEAHGEYKTLIHGEAVAIGMLMAAEVSHRLNHLSTAHLARIKKLIYHCGLGRWVGERPSADTLIAFMQQDKKNKQHKLVLILLQRLGEAYKAVDVPVDLLTRAIACVDL